MTQSTASHQRRAVVRTDDVHGSLWLLNVAILMLAGFAGGVVWASSDFEDSRLLYNGWSHLGVIALAMVGLLVAAVRYRGRLLLRLQIALLLSMLVHLGLVYYLHHQYLAILAHQEIERLRDATEPPDPRRTLPDYQFDSAGDVVMASDLTLPADSPLPDPEDAASREAEASTDELSQRSLENEEPRDTIEPEPVEFEKYTVDDQVQPANHTSVEVARDAAELPSAELERISLPHLTLPSEPQTLASESMPELDATAGEREEPTESLSERFAPLAESALDAQRERATALDPIAPPAAPAFDAQAAIERSQSDSNEQLRRAADIPRALVGATLPDSALQAEIPFSNLPGAEQPSDVQVSELANEPARGDLPELAEIATPAGSGTVDTGRPQTDRNAVQHLAVSPPIDAATRPLAEPHSVREVLRDRRRQLAENRPLPEATQVEPVPLTAEQTAGVTPIPPAPDETRLTPSRIEPTGPGDSAQRAARAAPTEADELRTVRAERLASIDRPRVQLEKSLPPLESAVDTVPAPAFRQRHAEERDRNAAAGGGTAGSERAVEQGLEFLARMQHADGRWSLHDFPREQSTPDAASGTIQADTAATGLALLSYLGAGYTHRDGKYRDTVRAGLNHLLANQKTNGDLFTGGAPYAWLYSHGIAAIALCEAYGMTRDEALRDPAQRALAFIVSAQHPTMGGWRYVPGRETDTSVSGWQMMALKSGELAGLQVPRETYQRVNRWLDHAAGGDAAGTRYAYLPASSHVHQREPSRAMTAEALLMRLYLGWETDDRRLTRGVDYLEEQLPRYGTRAERVRDTYYWYYATQVLFQVGGPSWETWNTSLRDLLVDTQIAQGPWQGSWHPTQPVPDRWGAQAGRLYVTTMHILMLEVYYRHLPLYQSLAQ